MFSVKPYVNPYPSMFVTPTSSKKEEDVVKPFKDKDARYVNYNASSHDGCTAYRRGFLGNHLMLTAKADVSNLTRMVIEENFYKDIKTVTLQRQASNNQKEFFLYLKQLQSKYDFKIIYEVDDVVFREDIPDYNASKSSFDTEEIRQNCIDMMNLADEVTVTCKFMRDLFIEKTGKKEITAIPNFMPYWWIGHQYDYRRIIDNHDKNKKRPRVVYAGSGAHFDITGSAEGKDDFSDVLKFIIDNRNKYRFVFIGAYPKELTKYVISREIEAHPWVDLLSYPNFLTSLNPQAFIAPLQDNNFNKSKSDIKFFEAAMLGIPCICQDMVTYATAPEKYRFKDADDLADKLEGLLNYKNRNKYYKAVGEVRTLGETRFLEREENVGSFMESLNTHYGDPSRIYIPRWNV